MLITEIKAILVIFVEEKHPYGQKMIFQGNKCIQCDFFFQMQKVVLSFRMHCTSTTILLIFDIYIPYHSKDSD